MLFQMLDALRFIHQSNVIHRDLKPANILVSSTDMRIKIADFGLSRVVSADLVVQHHAPSPLPAERDEDGDAEAAVAGGALSHPPQPPPSSSSTFASPAAPPAAPIRLAKTPLKRSLTKHVVRHNYRQCVRLVDEASFTSSPSS
jgi:serine/threonine protein kinase